MAIDNDTRGWIMTVMSGIACVLGSAVICVDVLVRLFPGKRGFKIQDSNAFMSASLSLSFGVMLFSSLYTMLPTAKSSLQKGGFSSKGAAWTLIGCFLAGVIGIQILSRVLHANLPSHVVDCDHTHDEEEAAGGHHDHHHHEEEHDEDKHQNQNHAAKRDGSRPKRRRTPFNAYGAAKLPDLGRARIVRTPPASSDGVPSGLPQLVKRPSFPTQISQIVAGTKPYCDEHGQCYGYTDVCGQECFKIVQARGSIAGAKLASAHAPKPPVLNRSTSMPQNMPQHPGTLSAERQPLLQQLQEVDEEPELENLQYSSTEAPNGGPATHRRSPSHSPPSSSHNSHDSPSPPSSPPSSSHHPIEPERHHHHVPTNRLLSLGLQTSLAIALHKLPEGFITYATNHANPRLGFSVFLALFIHNFSEGFAMALPLYLAINNRLRAMGWAALLGGASQPLGAALAVLVLRFAGWDTEKGGRSGEGWYGGMFAITAGIMASVALQLFSESLDLTHNRNLCMVFAFIGMGILGCSSALTA